MVRPIKAKKSIKELLPKGYVNILMVRSKLSKPTVIKVVNTEDMTHKLWPEVIKLAAERKQQIQKNINETRELMGPDVKTLGEKRALKQKLG
jgi:hypothetical protein